MVLSQFTFSIIYCLIFGDRTKFTSLTCKLVTGFVARSYELSFFKDVDLQMLAYLTASLLFDCKICMSFGSSFHFIAKF